MALLCDYSWLSGMTPYWATQEIKLVPRIKPGSAGTPVESLAPKNAI